MAKGGATQKKKERNVIVRRVKSSHMGSLGQTRKGSKAEHTMRSFSKMSERFSRHDTASQGAISGTHHLTHEEYEPVGQEMLEQMVHNKGGLTGDQIIELTELAHLKEQERNSKAYRILESSRSGDDEQLNEADPLAGAFEWHHIAETKPTNQIETSGAKRIQRLLDLGENEIIEDPIAQEVTNEQSFDKRTRKSLNRNIMDRVKQERE
jgi:hypothetical protein